MTRWLATAVANRLQNWYEKHRIPETWGSPRVSRYVFDTLRQEGFWAAHKDVRRRLRRVGHPGLSVGQKLTTLLADSYFCQLLRVAKIFATLDFHVVERQISSLSIAAIFIV